MGRVGSAVAGAVFFVVLSGAAMLAQAHGPTPTEAQRRECERNGGYWNTTAGYCRVGQ
jgi:hypothetical protein